MHWLDGTTPVQIVQAAYIPEKFGSTCQHGMSEHASTAFSPCQPESPSSSTGPLRNSRDCKAYLSSLPSGDAALHHAIKQAKQSVHSNVGAVVFNMFSKQ